MLKIENTEVLGWEHAIHGMRNPMNRLRNAGTDHRKFMRMITVYVDLTGPLYWWKEFDTYKVGTVANSCSTMHKIAAKEFTLEDFSYEHLIDKEVFAYPLGGGWRGLSPIEILNATIELLNNARKYYLIIDQFAARIPHTDQAITHEKEHSTMTINEYQALALRTESRITTDPVPYIRVLEGLMGLNGEAGEAIDLMKKVLFQGHEFDREHMAKELGDIAWYLAVSADAIGYDLESILQMNVDKLRTRYPDGFSTEQSLHRSANDI